MKVRGVELPWCTGPGWYFCFPNGAMPDGRDYAGPFKTQWKGIRARQNMEWNKGFCLHGEEVFKIVKADIEAET